MSLRGSETTVVIYNGYRITLLYNATTKYYHPPQKKSYHKKLPKAEKPSAVYIKKPIFAAENQIHAAYLFKAVQPLLPNDTEA